MEAYRFEYAAHYTYADYCRWEDKWELIDGVPYAMSPSPRFRHQEIAGNIFSTLKEQLKKCLKCKALYKLDWKISDDTVVCPDVVVVCRPITGDFIDFPPSIIFEVLSESTERKDRTVKFALYESQRVGYYCIVDTDKQSIEVYALGDKGYSKVFESGEGSLKFEGLECELRLEMEEIWE